LTWQRLVCNIEKFAENTQIGYEIAANAAAARAVLSAALVFAASVSVKWLWKAKFQAL
jgi:hypothetical protein